jgi:hypothetical protein
MYARHAKLLPVFTRGFSQFANVSVAQDSRVENTLNNMACNVQAQKPLLLPGPEHWFRYDGDFKIHDKPIHIHQEGGQVQISIESDP